MKKILISSLGILLIFLAACKNGDKKNNSANDLKAKADSVRQEAINEHNRGMKGWNNIEGRKKQIQALLDSIAALPAKAQLALSSLKAKLTETNAELSNAYKEMNDWMMVLNLDSAADNPEVRIQYFTNEKLKGSKITEFINNSLQKADSLLKARH